MSVDLKTGRHIPKDPTKFVFDEEVAPIFDNMAARSLPLYDHAYSIITDVCGSMAFKPGESVWDFGASTGRGLQAARDGIKEPLVEFVGVDISQPMIDVASKKCPWALFQKHDFESENPFPSEIANCKVMIWAWTLQFLQDPKLRIELLKQSYANLQPGGVLFLMEKWSHTGVNVTPTAALPSVFQTSYLRWRRDNAYTAHEIMSKSEALKNAMWPWSRQDGINALAEAGFETSKVFGLYQMFNFGGLAAFK